MANTRQEQHITPQELYEQYLQPPAKQLDRLPLTRDVLSKMLMWLPAAQIPSILKVSRQFRHALTVDANQHWSVSLFANPNSCQISTHYVSAEQASRSGKVITQKKQYGFVETVAANRVLAERYLLLCRTKDNVIEVRLPCRLEQKIVELKGAKQMMSAAAMVHGHLITADEKGSIYQWQFDREATPEKILTVKPVKSLVAHKDQRIKSLCQWGDRLVTSTEAGEIKIWDQNLANPILIKTGRVELVTIDSKNQLVVVYHYQDSETNYGLKVARLKQPENTLEDCHTVRSYFILKDKELARVRIEGNGVLYNYFRIDGSIWKRTVDLNDIADPIKRDEKIYTQKLNEELHVLSNGDIAYWNSKSKQLDLLQFPRDIIAPSFNAAPGL